MNFSTAGTKCTQELSLIFLPNTRNLLETSLFLRQKDSHNGSSVLVSHRLPSPLNSLVCIVASEHLCAKRKDPLQKDSDILPPCSEKSILGRPLAPGGRSVRYVSRGQRGASDIARQWA